VTNAVLAALEQGIEYLKAQVVGAAPSILAGLETVVDQLEPMIVAAVEQAVEMIFAGAAASTPVGALAAAIETATMSTLVAQGKPILESDALALKGVILAKIANTVAAAPAAAPEPVPEAAAD
jgi:riboflavin transporter FmnP